MEETEQIDQILTRYSPEREYLLPLLQEIQENIGYISRKTMERAALFFQINPIEVFSVVTFYKKFRTKPLGENHVQVCLGTACYFLGGNLIEEAFMRELKIEDGDTTADGKFSVNVAACFGCCNVAPVIKIKEQIVPRMTPGRVEEVIINIQTDK